MNEPLNENELWLLSFYRTSEISGALFFGRLARSQKPGDIQRDMSKHFADEAQHAWYWTSCITRLGGFPMNLSTAYQDQYVAAAGLPANMMEVLALTQTFERRVIGQYALHRKLPGLRPEVLETLDRIMQDETWHIDWVTKALRKMEPEYGKDLIEKTMSRYWQADQEVYRKTLEEHKERIDYLEAFVRNKGGADGASR